MNVVPVPGSLDHQTVDDLLDDVASMHEERLLFDARHVRWIDPNGMVALLAAGTVARDRQEALPRLESPESVDVLGYLSRMGFFREAEGIFEFDGQTPPRASLPSDVLLEITPIEGNADVHEVIDRVQSGAWGRARVETPLPANIGRAVLGHTLGGVSEHYRARGRVRVGRRASVQLGAAARAVRRGDLRHGPRPRLPRFSHRRALGAIWRQVG